MMKNAIKGLINFLRSLLWSLAWGIAIILIRKLPISDPDYQAACNLSVLGFLLSMIDVVIALFTFSLDSKEL